MTSPSSSQDPSAVRKEAYTRIEDEERKKISNLENLVKLLYSQKVKSDQDGNITMSMSPGEIKDLITLEENLMKLRRKVNGFLDW
jgi:hypothetical protein